MAPKTSNARSARLTIGIAQLLLVVAAAALWTASRLPWVMIRSFDGLGPPKSVTLSGAIVVDGSAAVGGAELAAAVAALAVRGLGAAGAGGAAGGW